MKTEDDTYKKLKQVPIRDVFKEFIKIKPENSFMSLPIEEITSPRIIEWLQSKGWDAEEFRDRINIRRKYDKN